jgi:hypothetical protein
LWHGCKGIFNAEAQRTQRFAEEIALLSEAQVPGEEEAIKEKKSAEHACKKLFFFSLMASSSPGICVRKKAISFDLEVFYRRQLLRVLCEPLSSLRLCVENALTLS